ncbi:hypothetical protein HK096_008935, partial [Nowakowskiella sp. JEL0078]
MTTNDRNWQVLSKCLHDAETHLQELFPKAWLDKTGDSWNPPYTNALKYLFQKFPEGRNNAHLKSLNSKPKRWNITIFTCLTYNTVNLFNKKQKKAIHAYNKAWMTVFRNGAGGNVTDKDFNKHMTNLDSFDHHGFPPCQISETLKVGTYIDTPRKQTQSPSKEKTREPLTGSQIPSFNYGTTNVTPVTDSIFHSLNIFDQQNPPYRNEQNII